MSGESVISVQMSPEGVIRVSLPEKADVTGPLAREAGARVRALAAGQPHPLLMDVTGVASISRDARNVYRKSVVVRACALLGQSPVDRVLAHFFLGAEANGQPVAYFTSETEALAWLEDQVRVY